MRPHPELEEQLAAYALDALDEAEARVVAAHLAHCATCQARLAELRETSSRIAGLTAGPRPSPALRGRVLQAVARAAPETPRAPETRPATRRPRWAWAVAAFALLAAQAWLVVSLVSLRAQVAQQAQLQAVLLSVHEAPVRLTAADPASPAEGFYRYERDLAWGVLNYYQLPPPAAGQAYACWMEFGMDAVQSCGRLPVDALGSGALLTRWHDATPTRILITLETGAASGPTGPTIMSAELFPEQP